MRILLTSTLLAGMALPMAPASGQSVDRGDLSVLGQSSTAESESLFSAARYPVLRGGEDATALVVDDNIAQIAAENGRIEYPVRQVQPVQPVQPMQGTGGRQESLGPYDPKGLRLGSFLLYPSLTLLAVATDNIDDDATKTSGRTGKAELDIRAQSNWSRHQLAIEARTGITGYQTPQRDADTNQYLDANLRLDLAERTNLTLTGRAERQRETASSAELAASGKAAEEQVDLDAGLTLDHSVGLLQMRLRGALETEAYEGDARRDFKTYIVGSRLGYRMTDQVIPFVDLEYSRKAYDQGPSELDGETWRGAIGIEVRDRQTVSGEISVGAMAWRPELASEQADEIFFADASVTWTPNALWTLKGGVGSSLTSSSTAATSVATHEINLSAEFAVRENLKLTANGEIEIERYNGISRKDLTFDATFGAEYSFNRNVQLIARVGHERRDSNEAGVDFASNRVELGLKFQR